MSALTREVGTFLENITQEQTPAQKTLKEKQAKALEQQGCQKIAQLQQILQTNQTWATSGHGRLLMRALTQATGSNVSGSTGQFMQAAAVNTLQLGLALSKSYV